MKKKAAVVVEPNVPVEKLVASKIDPWDFQTAIDLLNRLPTELERPDDYNGYPGCHHSASLRSDE